MSEAKALLLSVSTGMYMHFDMIPTQEFEPTHGILPLERGVILHYLNLMDRVAQLDLPDLEEVVFSDSRFKLLKTPFETEEDMARMFGATDVLSFTTAFGHSLEMTVVPEPRADLMAAYGTPPEFARLNMPAEGGMYFSGNAGRHFPPWESAGLDREFLSMQLANAG